MNDHRVRFPARFAGLLGLLTLLGCSAATRTPQQDYIYAMGRICEKADGGTSTRIERVDPDGRYWIRGQTGDAQASGEYPRFFACMREQYKAQPFFDWLKAQNRTAQQAPVAIGLTTGPATTPTALIETPTWQVGDEWRYAYKSPSGSWHFVWSVDRVEILEGAQHYVIKTGRREIFYRMSDLALGLETLDGAVVFRWTPSSTQYSWPLTLGKTWQQKEKLERRASPPIIDRLMVWTVAAEETVTVPAGTFTTLKITAQDKRSGATINEIWYSPDVKQRVKDRTFLTDGIQERELIAFKFKAQGRSEGKTSGSVLPETLPVVAKDDPEVERSFRKGAEAGDGRAMARLGWMYFTGQGGLVKDDAEAVRWFSKGAEAGDGQAMAFLGASYWVGLGGLARDDTAAVRWYQRGAAAGDGRAMALLGQVHLSGGGGLQKDEAEAVRWFRRGADAGDARAMTMLGQMCLDGEGGLRRDDGEALRWLRKGAEAGDGFAMATLGSMYETTEGGLTKDDREAVRWYRRGAEAGNGRAMAGLGSMYASGRGGLAQDDTEAVRWYRAGASLLDPLAMFELGQAYQAGQGVARDQREAVRWYRRAASLGSSTALDQLRALREEP